MLRTRILSGIALLAIAFSACNKQMDVPAENTDAPAISNGNNNARTLTGPRIVINGIDAGVGVTGYLEAQITANGTYMVDAHAVMARLGYTVSSISTAPRTATGSLPTGASNTVGALFIRFREGSNQIEVINRAGVTSFITMPAAAQWLNGRMLVPGVILAQQAGGAIVETDTDSQSLQVYYYEECDYGLYFIGSQANPGDGVIGAQKYVPGQLNRFFNASRPTIIYVHGWQPGGVTKRLRENLFMNAGGLSGHMQNEWISRGWNVAIFQWVQLADDDEALGLNQPDSVEVKIYRADVPGLGMRWKRTNGSKTTANAPNKCVAALLAQAINQVRAASGTQELRMIGNSLGGNLTMAALSSELNTLPKLPGVTNDVVSTANLPQRITLMDPYWSASSLLLGSITNNKPFGERSGRNLYNNNRPIEYYITSLLGENGLNRPLTPLCATVRFKPNFLGATDFGGRHTVPVKQYLHSISIGSGSSFPFELLPNGVTNTLPAMAASTSNARILQMAQQVAWWNHLEDAGSGSTTGIIRDDRYQQVAGEF